MKKFTGAGYQYYVDEDGDIVIIETNGYSKIFITESDMRKMLLLFEGEWEKDNEDE